MTESPLMTSATVAVYPEAALILCTKTDTIAEINQLARSLLGLDDGPPPNFATFIRPQLGKFLVFVDEVDTQGEAWTREINITPIDCKPLRCEIKARQIATKPTQILMMITDLNAMDRRAHVVEVAELQRAGRD